MNRRRLVYPLLVLLAAAIVWFFGLADSPVVPKVLRPVSPRTGSGADRIAPAPVPAPAPTPDATPAGR